MIQDLKKYPVYHDSGLPWIGSIPEGWEVRRNGRLFAQRNETGRAELPILEVSLRTGVGVRDFGNGERKQVMADPQKYKRAARGDLAYNMMRMWQGALGVSPTDGLVSPAYIVARPFEDVEARYYAYLFRTGAYLSEVDKFSRGIVKDRNRLYWEDFKRIQSLYPPKVEQAAIVRFLDYADRKVKPFLHAKRKLIALLNEQIQVIIHQAVTRGLDFNVRLRSSGQEWLGSIPEHWSLKRFKFLASIQKGQVDPNNFKQMNKILIAPNHIQSGSGVITYLETAEEQGASSGKYEVRKGQIIYSKIRPNLAKAAIAPSDCLCSADMYPISVLEKEIVTEYFLLLLLSKPFTKFAVDSSLRVAMPKVNRDVLKECWLWYPDINEQKCIIQYVGKKIIPLKAEIKYLQHEIELIRELRTRLISDVVMGKLDVREVSTRLPDIPEAGEILDECEEDIEDASEDHEAEEVEA